MKVLDRLADADAVQPGGPGVRTIGEHCRDLLDQAAAHHLLRTVVDPLVQHGSGHGEMYVPGAHAALSPRGNLPPGERSPSEQDDLYCSRGALASTAGESGIEPVCPTKELSGIERVSPRLERAPAGQIERRLEKQAVHERLHVESGPPDDHGKSVTIP